MSDSTETTESFPPLPASENVAESGLIANAELAAGLEAEPSAVPESEEGMWAAIRESLRGSHRDYTVGPIGFLAVGIAARLRAVISFGMGPRGVFIAITIAFSTLAVVSAVVFQRGRWKTRVV